MKLKNFRKEFLYTPGPTEVPRRVQNAYARPMLHHRTEEFSALLTEMERRMQALFNTKNIILPIHSSGRGALEANILNFFSPGDEIICLCNGKFALMVAEIAQIYGLNVHKVCESWLEVPNLDEIEDTCNKFPNSKGITMCMNESSTGVMLPIEPIAAIARAHNMVCIVDAVSIAAGYPIDFDTCGADAISFASQKCLMCSPGLAFTILNDRCWELCKQSTMPKFFINYLELREKFYTPFPETISTTPVTEIFGLIEALKMIEEEGLENVYARHVKNALATRAAVKALGFTLFPDNIPDDYRSVTLTAFTTNDPSKNLNTLQKMLKNEHGVYVAGSTAKEYSGKLLRIGHMGFCFRRDILTLFACVEDCLYRLGWTSRIGDGLAAALEAFNKK